jgi:dihydrofolate reductase
MEAEAQLLGRVTYEAFAGAWPKMEGTGEFGERMNSMPKYVLSSTLQQADWNNTTILRGDPADVIPGLKQEVEGIILVAGSAQLVQALVEADLVDELRLMVFPIILGQGKRLFGPTATKKAMQLTAQETVGDGVEILTYRPR